MIFADLLTVAKKLNNYAEDSGTWDSTTLKKFTVPADKRWIFIVAGCSRDNSSTLNVSAKDSTGNKIAYLGSESAGMGYKMIPTSIFPDEITLPIVLDAGEYVEFAFGTAQGAAAWCSCMVMEVSV